MCLATCAMMAGFAINFLFANQSSISYVGASFAIRSDAITWHADRQLPTEHVALDHFAQSNLALYSDST